MTRFEQELSGSLGTFWKENARKELEKVKTQIENGEITIDENGVARNRIGRVVMRDMLEKITYVTDQVNESETIRARDEETAKSIEEYRKNAKPLAATELAEMRAAFGEGETVIDILTGKRYSL